MDPKLVEHYEGEIERANIQPRKRERILAKYGTVSA
jgi:alkane 1-monooxygenase